MYRYLFKYLHDDYVYIYIVESCQVSAGAPFSNCFHLSSPVQRLSIPKPTGAMGFVCYGLRSESNL